MYDVLYVGCMLPVTNEVIKAVIMDGQRPLLNEITGPADMVLFAKKWISLCWHQTPELRPSFNGMVYTYTFFLTSYMKQSALQSSPSFFGKRLIYRVGQKK